MTVPAINKKKVFFVKETSDDYNIDVSKLKSITRKQMETYVKKSATKPRVAAAKKSSHIVSKNPTLARKTYPAPAKRK